MSAGNVTEKSILKSKLILIPMAIMVYLIAVYAIRPFVVEGFAWFILDLNSVVLALVAVLVFAIVAHRFGWLKTRPGQISVILVIGFILWTLAETFWLWYESVGLNPFPSIADFFYIAGYFPFAIALLLNIRTIHVKFKLPILILWIALSLIAFAVIAIIDVAPILQGAVNPEDIIGIVYPLEDLVIIVLALVIVLKFRAGEIAKAWGVLVLGFILEAIGDILFLYEQNTGIYQTTGPYDIVDLILSLGYVAFIASGLLFISTFGARGGRKSA
ncbi:MAG: hypothetical protein WED05_05455 [Candidatus Atabeyarchaeum deiterrae]